jgi:hypothetical protein
MTCLHLKKNFIQLNLFFFSLCMSIKHKYLLCFDYEMLPPPKKELSFMFWKNRDIATPQLEKNLLSTQLISNFLHSLPHCQPLCHFSTASSAKVQLNWIHSLKLAFKIVIAQWFSHHLGIDHLFYYCFMSTGLPILQYICHSLFLHALEWTPGTSLSAFLYSKAVMHTSGGSYKM